MKITEHFSHDEIVCHCGCGQGYIDFALFDMLEEFRKLAGNNPMITHCVNRCITHNKKIGGAKRSKHLSGRAWDGHVSNVQISKLHEIAKHAYETNLLSGGLGIYDWGIHIDTGSKRTWEG